MRSRFMFIAGVLTLAVLVGWAVNTVTSDNATYQANAGDVVLVECEAGSRANVSRAAFSIGRVVCANVTATAAVPTTTSTATPTTVPPSTATAEPTHTSTPTPTASSVPTPTSAATPTGTDVCSGNPDCGTPRFFCSTTGPWAFCNDYRQVGATVFETPFDLAANKVSFDCLDTGTPSYEPSMLGGTLPGPMVFTKYEHFMTRMESGGFGDCLMRFHQPVDLTAERHIHFDADLKPQNTRNYFRFMLTPDLTKRDQDDRGGQAYPRSFITGWFRNGSVEGSICRQGVCEGDSYPWGDAFRSVWPPMPTADNVRKPIDIYITQTSIRIYIDGQLKVNDTFAPLGFDAAYLYLTQASYNPCKDGRCAVADQVSHWDNVAWDGPVRGSLVPDGYRDVAFNAYGAQSCTVNTVMAVAQTNGPIQGWTWTTFVARIVNDGRPLAIQCTPGNGWSLASQPIRGVEVVVP